MVNGGDSTTPPPLRSSRGGRLRADQSLPLAPACPEALAPHNPANPALKSGVRWDLSLIAFEISAGIITLSTSGA